MSHFLLVNGRIVNEGRIHEADVRVSGARIEAIGSNLAAAPGTTVIDLSGRHLLPGLIDDQVHFREPGLTHKATIASESLAAICGGVTSFMDMPNTNPPTVDRAALARKREIASRSSHANYAFY